MNEVLTPANFPLTVDCGRNGERFLFTFDNVKMDKHGIWTFTIAIDGDMKEFEIAHSCAFVLDPSKTEEFLESKRSQFLNPQEEMDFDGDTILDRMRKAVTQYEKDAVAFGIHDFDASVRKVDRGNRTKITFRIDQKAALGIVDKVDLLMSSKCAIVIGQYRDNGRNTNTSDSL